MAEKLRVYEVESREDLDRYEALLWRLAQHQLSGQAEFDDEKLRFTLAGENYFLKP